MRVLLAAVFGLVVLISILLILRQKVEHFAYRDELAIKYVLRKEKMKQDTKKSLNDWIDGTDEKVTGQVMKTLYPELYNK
jgi:hypothetical protein